jgi:hypothetical protein
MDIADHDEDDGMTSDQIAFNALEEVKLLEWGKEDTEDSTILERRQKIIGLLERIASNHPDQSIRKKITTNAKNLTKFISKRFKLEGSRCPPPCAKDGCYRHVYSVQLSYLRHTTNSLVAQKARCFDASKDLYNDANVVLNAKVSPLIHPLPHSITIYSKGRGDFSTLIHCLIYSFTILLLEIR